MRGSRGDGVASGPPTPEKHKALTFLINTGPDPIEYRKATKPALNDVSLVG